MLPCSLIYIVLTILIIINSKNGWISFSSFNSHKLCRFPIRIIIFSNGLRNSNYLPRILSRPFPFNFQLHPFFFSFENNVIVELNKLTSPFSNTGTRSVKLKLTSIWPFFFSNVMSTKTPFASNGMASFPLHPRSDQTRLPIFAIWVSIR